MAHDEHRGTAGSYRVQDGLLGVGVQSGGGLVEHEQPGPAQLHPSQGSGQRHAASLPGRQPLGIVRDLLGESQRLAPAAIQQLPDLRVAEFGMPQSHIVGDGAVDEARSLWDVGDLFPPRLQGGCTGLAQVDVANPDRSGLRCQEAQQTVHRRRLAATGMASQGDELAGFDAQAHTIHGRGLRVGVGVGQLVDDERGGASRRDGLGVPGCELAVLDEAEGLLGSCHAVRRVVVEGSHLAQGQVHLGGQNENEQ